MGDSYLEAMLDRDKISKENSNYEDYGKSKISIKLVATILVIFIGIATVVIYDFSKSKGDKALNMPGNNNMSVANLGNQVVMTENTNANVVSPAMVYSANTNNTTENENAINPAGVNDTMATNETK